ncbi:MAG: hypothetical protein IK088_07545 [Lachnospiraceae bacterium]|nr:hypothetical protein [Lachnospiraceae bacterium]
MMEDCYAESNVKRKSGAREALILASMILGVLVSITVIFLSKWGILLLAAVILVIIFTYRYVKVEYETIFVGGEIQIDKIYSGETRKKGPRVDLSNAETVEQATESFLETIRKNPEVKIEDYSSHTDNPNKYAVLFNEKGARKCLLFEPSDKMLKLMYRISPSKVKVPREILLQK